VLDGYVNFIYILRASLAFRLSSLRKDNGTLRALVAENFEEVHVRIPLDLEVLLGGIHA
jgi:hypothetical protein